MTTQFYDMFHPHHQHYHDIMISHVAVKIAQLPYGCLDKREGSLPSGGSNNSSTLPSSLPPFKGFNYTYFSALTRRI